MKRLVLFICLLIFVFSGILFAKTKVKKTSAKKSQPAANSAFRFYAAGEKSQKTGDLKNAAELYNAAIKIDKKYWQAWLGLGICYYDMKKLSNAKLIFKQVLMIKPGEKTALKYYKILSNLQPPDMRGQKKAVMLKSEMMWRSALLPGLGQFYNNEYAKGYLYTIGYLAGAACIIKFTIDQQAAVAAYHNATSDFNVKYKAAEDAGKIVFIPAGAAALLLAASVIDAFISGADSPVKNRKTGLEFRNDSTLAYKIIDYRF